VILEGDDTKSVRIKSGALLYVDWTQVNRDPMAFEQPASVELKRESTLYKLAEPGIRSCEYFHSFYL
jgi:cytochrome P450